MFVRLIASQPQSQAVCLPSAPMPLLFSTHNTNGETAAMNDSVFDYSRLYSAGLPDPAPKWAPFPKYYFVGGNNDPDEIPIEGLIDAAASVLRREGSKLAIYNLGLGPQGYPGPASVRVGQVAPSRGINAPIEDILITTGSGQGLDMISKLLINPGDTVLAEEYCYQGALNRFRKLGAKLEGMKLDADGIVIDALAQQLADAESQGHHAEIHLHDPDDPEPHGLDPAAGPPPRADPTGARIQRRDLRRRVLR